MDTTAGVGVSQNKKDSFRAGKEAAESALSKLDSESCDLVILFTTDEFDQRKVLDGVRSVTGKAELIGCCAGGVITDEGIDQGAIAVACIKFEDLVFLTTVVDHISKNHFKAGEKFGKQLLKNVEGNNYDEFENRTVMMFPNGFSEGNISELVQGAYNIFGASYRFSGGGTGDNLKFKKTYQFLNDKIYNDAVVGILFLSKKPQGIGLKHGWVPTDRNFIITKTEGKVVKEIDGSPALEVYMNYRDQDLDSFDYKNFYTFCMNNPFGIAKGEGEYIIRDPLSASLKDKSITFVSEIPVNSVVRFMEGDKQSVLDGSREAALQGVKQMEKGKQKLCIIFDCVSRLLLLEKDAKKELQNIRSEVGKKCTIIGIYAFGEIGAGKGGPAMFHNKTCVVHTIS